MPKKARKKIPGGSRNPRSRQRGSSDDVRLVVTARRGAVLSPAQARFNSLMRRLEKARDQHRREEERLNAMLQACGMELMPLIDEVHRLFHDLVLHGQAALKSHKFSDRRRHAFIQMLRNRAGGLVRDCCGLSEAQIEAMRQVARDLAEPTTEHELDGEDGNDPATEFDFLRAMAQATAREAGVPLDLSDLDPNGDPEVFEQELQRRLDAALRGEGAGTGPGRTRKPTKAQLAKETREREVEEAKRRDLKSLYKQLAKVLHPDLESDPALRPKKEEWMKRLTQAYAEDDLRELLAIEMEWMGAESSNLAQATDEKLMVYTRVLKEQLDALEFRTAQLRFEPQYAPLHRFVDPFFRNIPPIAILKEELLEEIERSRGMLATLQAGPPHSTGLLNKWAEDEARQLHMPAWPF
jgi:hypothetical protein